MKSFTLLSIFLFIIALSNAQTIDFETLGADLIWNEMANGGVAPLVDSNPSKDDVNSSDNVLFFPIQENGNAWAGTFADVDEFTVEGNGIIRIKVLKPIISDVGFKIEAGPNGTGASLEIKIPNSLIGEWEMMEYDFTEKDGESYSRIVIMPEFSETRVDPQECYVDDIEFFTEQTGIESMYKASFHIYASNNKVAFKGIDQVEHVEIFNLAGQMVASKKSDAIRTFEISNLQKGIYVVKARSGNEIAVVKITKQ